MTELVIITGASKGFGKQLAITFAANRPNANFLLLSRTTINTSELLPNLKGKALSKSVDLSNVTALPATLKSLFAEAEELTEQKKYEKVTLINNAGSIKPIERMDTLFANDANATDVITSIQQSIELNNTSCFVFSAYFLHHFSSTPSVFVVDVSSGAARNAYPTWGAYCVNKAARFMCHKVIAAEHPNGKSPDGKREVKSLAFGPGVMATNMQQVVQTHHSSTQQMLHKIISTGQAVPVERSAKELEAILAKNEFTSGEMLDMYALFPELAPKI